MYYILLKYLVGQIRNKKFFFRCLYSQNNF
jgi:hypothetical protein